MITSFNDDIFNIKKLSKYITIFVLYALLLRSFNSYSLDLIPQVHVRELLVTLFGETFTIVSFGAGVSFVFVPVMTLLIDRFNFENDFEISYRNVMENTKISKGNFNLLDFSNPFLLSCKTKGLRE